MKNDRVYNLFRKRIDILKEDWRKAPDYEIYDYLGIYFKLLQVSIMDRYDMRPPIIPEKTCPLDICHLQIIRSELNQTAKLWDIIIKEVRESLDIKNIYPNFDPY
jgi:hypothetical protein